MISCHSCETKCSIVNDWRCFFSVGALQGDEPGTKVKTDQLFADLFEQRVVWRIYSLTSGRWHILPLAAPGAMHAAWNWSPGSGMHRSYTGRRLHGGDKAACMLGLGWGWWRSAEVVEKRFRGCSGRDPQTSASRHLPLCHLAPLPLPPPLEPPRSTAPRSTHLLDAPRRPP